MPALTYHSLLRLATRICLLCTCVSMGIAQPAVDVYWNIDAPRDTVVDFGVTLQGFPVTRTLSIRNRSASTVVVEATRPDAEPYFIIINDTVNGVPVAAPNKEEYLRSTPLPVYVQPGKIGDIQIQFRAVVGDPRLPPDVVNRCLLDIRIADSTDPIGPSTDKRFTLLGLKTTRILASSTPVIRFDSVWVEPQPVEPTRDYVLTNVLSRQIDVEAQLVRTLTPVVGRAEITVDTFPRVSFPERGNVTWNVHYRPHDKGRDSAHFLVRYRPDVSSALDSVTLAVVGVGVLQHVRLLDARGATTPVRVNGDTIDFGDVAAAGVGALARIIVQNDGNCPVHILAEERLGTTRDSAAFVVERMLSADGPVIRVGDLDTLTMRFSPNDAGDHQLRYIIKTDLRSRPITGVPDGVQDATFYVKGRGLRPQIQSSPAELDFGNIVLLTDCPSQESRTLRIANVGNADLRIDSITTEPTNAPIRFDRTLLNIRPGGQETIIVIFQPTMLGSFSGNLQLHSNGLRLPVFVGYRGRAVAPDTITVSLPKNVRARPGSVILVPVQVDGAKASLASRFVMRMTYDPSLMRFRSIVKANAGAEGAIENVVVEAPPGSLTVDLTAQGNFRSVDTLLWLTFDTFLGRRSATQIAVTNAGIAFGNAGCANVLNVNAVSGRFELDSVCGLSYKTIVDNVQGMAAAVFPNPATQSSTVAIVIDDEQHVIARLVDAHGTIVKVLHDATLISGSHLIDIPLRNLEAGVYFVYVLAGRRQEVKPLVVLP